MAQGKKSFIAYSDWNGMFKALPDDVAGKLIKHIFSYVNDENPSTDDYVINALFEQIKSTLKRDLKKWETQTEQRREAGKRSAEIRKQNATKSNERSISSTDSVSVSVSVSDNENVIDNDKEREIKAAHSRNLENSIIHSIENSEKKIRNDKEFIRLQSKILEISESKIIELIPKFFNLIKYDPEKNYRELGKHKAHFISWIPYEIKRETKPKQRQTPSERTMEGYKELSKLTFDDD